jgi:hypothetical protein
MRDALDKRIAQSGMSEQQKQIDDYSKSLDALRAKIGADQPNEMVAEFAKDLAKLNAQEAALKRQADLAKSLRDIDNDWYARNLTDIEKKILALRKLGATTEQVALAAQQLAEIEKQQKADDERKELADSILEIEKQAAAAGLSDTEKRVQAARALHATEQEIARIRAAGAKIEANERDKKAAEARAKAVDDRKREADAIKKSAEGPLETFKRKMADIQRLSAFKSANFTSADAAAAAAAAEKELRESFKTKGGDIDSPKALLKGTAEAALAEDRAKNPVEKLTDIQRQALAEAKRARAALEAMNAKSDRELENLINMQF